jgi:FkbH-like protein
MKLIEALDILRKAPAGPEAELNVFLACGFTPLHLQTMLKAEVQLLYPDRRISMETGLFGDLIGSLKTLSMANSFAGIVVAEWQDLDPRLAMRSLGSWLPEAVQDIVKNARSRAAILASMMENECQDMRLVVCLPTLPLPPVFFTGARQMGKEESELRACLAFLAAKIAALPHVTVLNQQHLDLHSPLAERFDLNSEIRFGFPYRMAHAGALAEAFGRLLRAPIPKKGLITDLDGTLWQGILGEVGPEGVFWDSDHHAHMYGAYQRLLHALSAEGVLLGIATKNDPHLIERVFEERSPLLPRSSVFPIEAHWGAKSESIARILKTWNIAADSVIFVDNDPMELAEVKARHPGIECIRFPEDDAAGIYDVMNHLRERFAKRFLLEEDAIRLESIRRGHSLQTETEASTVTSEQLLESAEAELTLYFDSKGTDPRGLELVNKSNQFNLNGRRHIETSWKEYAHQGDAFLMIVAYRDKFGPLGKVAVLAGRIQGRKLSLDTWVMSCRAFSRRIEHRCLEELFARFGVDEIEFAFVPTPRNMPMRLFLEQILGANPESAHTLSKEVFLERQPKTYQRTLEIMNG